MSESVACQITNIKIGEKNTIVMEGVEPGFVITWESPKIEDLVKAVKILRDLGGWVEFVVDKNGSCTILELKRDSNALEAEEKPNKFDILEWLNVDQTRRK